MSSFEHVSKEQVHEANAKIREALAPLVAPGRTLKGVEVIFITARPCDDKECELPPGHERLAGGHTGGVIASNAADAAELGEFLIEQFEVAAEKLQEQVDRFTAQAAFQALTAEGSNGK